MTRPFPRLPAPDPRPDGELLAAFASFRDDEAFAVLVRRHARLVWAACRRHLPDPADAEDAFQAAFLVLVRKAGRHTRSACVGPWLARVAAYTARNLRRKNARRLARTRPFPSDVPAPPPVPVPDLDSALLSLPEKYRTPLVLCHLEGLTRRQAAARLGCPEGTLSALVSRGLAKLRAKLSRDPLTLTAATLPAGLTAATARAAAAFRLAAVPPSTVFHLIEGAIRMFWVKKATAAGLAGVLMLAAGFGLGVSVRQAPATAADDAPAATAAGEPPAVLVAPPQADPVAAAAAAHAKAELAARRAQEELRDASARLQRAKHEQEVQERRAKARGSAPDALRVFVVRIDAHGSAGKQKRNPFHVIQRTVDGQIDQWAMIANADALRQFIAQVWVTSETPTDIHVHAGPEATADDVRQAIAAFTAAGFVGGRVSLDPAANVRIARPQRYSIRENAYTFARLADAVVEPKPAGDVGRPPAFRVAVGSETVIYDNTWRLRSARTTGPAVRPADTTDRGATIVLTAAAAGTARVYLIDKDGKETEIEVTVE